MKYPGYNRIAVHNDRFNPNDEIDIVETPWMQTDYIVDYDFVSMNGIVHLNNGNDIDIRTKGDMNEMTMDTFHDAMNAILAISILRQQNPDAVMAGDEYAEKHGFPKDSLRQMMIDSETHARRMQTLNESALPDDKQHVKVLITGDYLQPDDMNASQSSYDLTNPNDIKTLHDDMHTNDSK